MELIDLLGPENSHVKKAIQFFLDSNMTEDEWYTRKQRFTLSYSEIPDDKKIPQIEYCSQREHAIDWIFSKALWEKSKGNNKLDLIKVIRNIQSPLLIVYLAIITGIVPVIKVKEFEKEVVKALEKLDLSSYNPKNIRFAEKEIVLSKIDNENWAEDIAEKIAN